MKATTLVAAIYAYFLLFAQFAFLRGIHATGAATDVVHAVLGVMALTGIAASLVAPFAIRRFGAATTMAAGLFFAALAAALAAGSISNPAASVTGMWMLESGLTGVGLALATVSLASDLRRLTRARAIGLHVGLGTAAAYFFCNVPAIFSTTPGLQCRISAAVAALAVPVTLIGRRSGESPAAETRTAGDLPAPWFTRGGIVAAVAAFFALVWFDSAAFAAVQLDAAARARFWGEAHVLWRNGAAHALAAVAAGWWIDHGSLRALLAIAMSALIVGAFGFQMPGFAGSFAAPIYAAGVSIYSTALAAFAALGREDPAQPSIPMRAAWLYAIAGWAGSTLGVGLAEQRGSLPIWAAPVAAAVLTAALVVRKTSRNVSEAPA